MSTRRERVEQAAESADPVVELLREWYQVPVLAILMGFMFWVRMLPYDRFVSSDDVLFSGNDPWYHLREVQYVVRNWPSTMPFDPWTFFPFGTSGGAFGTLFDQLVGTAALIVGLGNPSPRTVALTLLVTPAVMGTLVALPTYYITKRLRGRFAGLFAVLALALFPGVFLSRSIVGSADHNIAEPLFQSLAILAMMVALAIAEREKPVFELLLDRDWPGLRAPVGWSAIAGVALALYVWVWPPATLLVGIFGVFFTIVLVDDYRRGRSPEHLAFVGATAMAVGGVLMLVPLQTIDPKPARFTILQPALSFGVAAGCVFLAWLAREWDGRDLSPDLYPVTVGALLVAGVGLFRVALPNLFQLIRNNMERILLFGQSAGTRTIAEAQSVPLDSLVSFVRNQYGWAFFLAIFGALVLLLRWYAEDERPAEEVLVVVWAAFITAAAFTQVRFNYYLAVPVAVLTGVMMGEVVSLVGVPDVESPLGDIEAYQVMVVLAVVLLVVTPLAPPMASDTVVAQTTANSTGPGGIAGWDGALQWMQTNTPEEGTYGGAGEPMAYHGSFRAGDGNFDYPPGSYGVMSWWDYGHWITVRGERIPNANPFQQGATEAANFLLAPNETVGNARLDELSDDGAKTRYVMVDWQMAYPGSKFGAPTVFYDAENVTTDQFYDPIYQVQQTGVQPVIYLNEQRYYESMMIRLYRFHGSSVPASNVVVNYDLRQFRNQNTGETFDAKVLPSGEDRILRPFRTRQGAERFVRNDTSASIGGYGPYPPERIEALQHYRLVAVSDRQMPRQLRQQFQLSPAFTKVFERVEGAEVRGTGPANTSITAEVEMAVPGTGTTFNYTQRAQTGPDGSFTMTLPYSTTGYENWGPENGFTNVSVRATGPYDIRSGGRLQNGTVVFHNATVDVSEAKVIGQDDEPMTVELTEERIDFGFQSGNQTTNGTGNGSVSTPPADVTGSGETAGGTTDDAPSTGPASDAPSPPAARTAHQPALPERP